MVFSAGLNLLPNNNILKIISKANQDPYRQTVLNLFDTDKKILFRYDNRHLNFLFLNGVVEPEAEPDLTYSTRFSSPFVQKRLFHFFADELTPSLSRLYNPFEDMSATITDTSLSVPHLMRRYEVYLQQNRERILKNAPRRETDDRVIEAIFHFNLYTWLYQFLSEFDGRVTPEFPTGNGQINLLITYADRLYGVEVKSFTNRKKYQDALGQAARYGKTLEQSEIWLVFFVEAGTTRIARNMKSLIRMRRQRSWSIQFYWPQVAEGLLSTFLFDWDRLQPASSESCLFEYLSRFHPTQSDHHVLAYEGNEALLMAVALQRHFSLLSRSHLGVALLHGRP
ncbi:MAG: hypothetical protein AAF702_24765 [Chloroflexota bacterium]